MLNSIFALVQPIAAKEWLCGTGILPTVYIDVQVLVDSSLVKKAQAAYDKIMFGDEMRDLAIDMEDTFQSTRVAMNPFLDDFIDLVPFCYEDSPLSFDEYENILDGQGPNWLRNTIIQTEDREDGDERNEGFLKALAINLNDSKWETTCEDCVSGEAHHIQMIIGVTDTVSKIAGEMWTEENGDNNLPFCEEDDLLFDGCGSNPGSNWNAWDEGDECCVECDEYDRRNQIPNLEDIKNALGEKEIIMKNIIAYNPAQVYYRDYADTVSWWQKVEELFKENEVDFTVIYDETETGQFLNLKDIIMDEIINNLCPTTTTSTTTASATTDTTSTTDGTNNAENNNSGDEEDNSTTIIVASTVAASCALIGVAVGGGYFYMGGSFSSSKLLEPEVGEQFDIEVEVEPEREQYISANEAAQHMSRINYA